MSAARLRAGRRQAMIDAVRLAAQREAARRPEPKMASGIAPSRP